MTATHASASESTSSIDRYLSEITGPALREDLTREFNGLQRQFGLVFERHHPEDVRLPKHTIKRGSKVVISPANGKPRKDSEFYCVHKLNRDDATAVVVDAEGERSDPPCTSCTRSCPWGTWRKACGT